MSNRKIYQQHTEALEQIVGEDGSHPGRLAEFQSTYRLYKTDTRRLFEYVQNRITE